MFKLTLMIDEPLSEEEIKELRYLFADAFAEFQNKRRPARQYVDERYPLERDGKPTGTYFVGEVREAKIAQVERRIRLAEKIRIGALTDLKVEPVWDMGDS